MKACVLAVLCLLFSFSALAQSTTVSGTITDAGGQAWISGTYSFVFKPSPSNPTGQYFWNGTPFNKAQTIQGDLDGSGHFSVSLPSNTSITPSGSTWVPTFCSIARGNSPCFAPQTGLTITGPTQDISGSVIPPAISIDLAHAAYPFVTAYTSTEISTATIGSIFYNFLLAHYFICEAIAPTGNDQVFGSCTNWKEICQQGDTTCGGTGSAESFQHNGVAVGTQPTFNVIDTGTVIATLVNDAGNNRVNMSLASSGGAGCGVGSLFDKWIVFIHPNATCDGSAKLTWDNTKQNFSGGDGTSTFASDATNTFNFGTLNTIQDISDIGDGSTGLVIGDANNLFGVSAGSPSQELYIVGDSNNLQRAQNEAYIIGQGNRIRDVTFDHFILGDANRFESATPGTPANMQQGFAVGGSNIATAVPGSSLATVGFTGFSNEINVSNGKSVSNVFFHGLANTAVTNTQDDHDLFAFGSRNTFEDTLNLTEQAMSLGFNNDINGANSTAQTLGIFNALHNVSINNGNTVVVGGQNAATNLGGLAGPATYEESFGHLTNLHNCSDCLAIGANVDESTDHTMGIGMSAAPEIIITPGGVNITAWPVTQVQAKIFTGCTVAAGTYNECVSATQTWTKPFADSSYALVCTAFGTNSDGGGKESYIVYWNTKTASNFTVRIQNNRGSTVVDAVEIDCTGTHP